MASSWESTRHSWEEGGKRFRSAWTGFKEFILRENVLEVAVGLIIATAFTRIVNSMVSDMLTPFISLLPFMGRNLPQQFVVLRNGEHPGDGYNTIAQAEADGAVTLNYGRFIDTCLNFLFIGLVLYMFARLYGWLSGESIIKHSYKCSYCRKEIAEKAQRCPFCSTWLDGREERETSALAPGGATA